MRLASKQSGFTLVELLLYLALAALMFGAITSFLVMILSNRLESEAMIEVEQQGSALSQTISSAIKNSSGVNYPAKNNSSSSLSLIMASTAKDPTIFYSSNGSFFIKEGSGNPVSLINNSVIISNIDFSNLGRANSKDSIKFRFNLKYATSSASQMQEFEYNKNFYGSANRR